MSISEQFYLSDSSFLIAPAGCGKTQAIAEAVSFETHGVQLILTHTHAGVQSLKNRLRLLNVPARNYEVETIASWALRICLHFPVSCGIVNPEPQSDEWKAVYAAAVELLEIKAIKAVIQASYRGVFVDEYQDCTIGQHHLIIGLRDILPCRIVGDPLQAIFRFGKEKAIDWDTHVRDDFEELPYRLQYPFRWKNRNEKLGQWLILVRENLLEGKPIDFSGKAFVRWQTSSASRNQPIAEISSCFQFVRNPSQTTVVIHPENSATQRVHDFASKLKGRYCSLEEMEARDLLACADRIHSSHGNNRVTQLVDFCKKSRTGISQLSTIYQKFEHSVKPQFRRTVKFQTVADAFLAISESDDLELVLVALQMINDLPDSYIYRNELWYGMQRALTNFRRGAYSSLREAAWHARQQDRILGRYKYPRVVARTLLVKGLEFDNAVVLWAEQLDRNNLYVALTRASTSLVVHSQSPVFDPKHS